MSVGLSGLNKVMGLVGEQLTIAISRYNDKGYERPSTKSTMIARLSVSSQRMGISYREGKVAAKTCGMVSPIMMQKATMPPKAKAHWATEMAMRPLLPKHFSMVAWKLSAPESLELVTMSRIVQSTVMVKAMRSKMPVRRPACLKAYGWPMMPAPMILLAIFMNALLVPLLGLADSK